MPAIDHVNLHVRDARAVIAFLEAVLGASEGERPPFRHPGHWVYLEGRPVFHIDYASDGEGAGKGLFDHIAFGVFEYEPLRERVEASGYPYRHAGIPGGVGQIFVEGPEGLKIELQYHR